MIYGQSGLNDRSKYHFIQDNNAIENFVLKLLGKVHYESCGNTAATAGAHMMSLYPEDCKIVKDGIWECQREDYLFLFLNDARNYKTFLKVRSDLEPKLYPGNRIPQYYVLALKQVFNIDSKFDWANSTDWIREIKNKNVVMVCLKKPGHYILLTHYDTVSDEFIFNDPWAKRKGLKNGGFMERIKLKDLEKNNKGFSVTILNRRLNNV